jgi:hypothetical protein
MIKHGEFGLPLTAERLMQVKQIKMDSPLRHKENEHDEKKQYHKNERMSASMK